MLECIAQQLARLYATYLCFILQVHDACLPSFTETYTVILRSAVLASLSVFM